MTGEDELDRPDGSLLPHEVDFIEGFSEQWSRSGGQRMEGRVLAYLMVTTRPEVSSANIVSDLQASTGAVSMATRALTAAGYIVRHQRPGDRSYYFRAQDDMWGSFLSTERSWVRPIRTLLDGFLLSLPTGDDRAHRVATSRDYMLWLEDYNRRMIDDWEAFRRSREEDRHDR